MAQSRLKIWESLFHRALMLTKHPTLVEALFGREVHVETSAEIVAKKCVEIVKKSLA